MMTQSVMTQAAGLFARASGSVTLKGKQTGNDFDLLIGSSMKTAQGKTAIANATTVKASTQADKSKNSIKSDDRSSDDAQSKTVQANKTVVNADTTKGTEQKTSKSQTDVSGAVVEDDKADVTKDLTEDEQLMAQIEAMLQSIGQAVMDKLNLSPEELNQLLTDQGMSLSDLLNPENLQQLILASSGKTDVLAFLTDESLADTMKQLLQTVEEIKQNNKLDLTADQIKALLEQAKEQNAAQNGTEEVPSVSKNEAITETLNSSAQKDTKTETKSTENQKENSSANATVQNETTKENSVAASAGKDDTAGQRDNGRSEKNMNTSDRFQTFVDNLVKSSQNLQSDFAGEMTQVTRLRDIANQIIDRIKISVSTSKTSMELSLNPESLGKVNLSVQSKDGALTAHFVVQNQVSKEAIESQIQTLRDTLHQQGIKVEAIEVTVASNAFDQSNNQSSEQETQTKQSNSGRQITLEDALQMTEAQDDDTDLNELTGTSGNVINYTA